MNKNEIKSIKNFVDPKDAKLLIDFMDKLKLNNKLSNERKDNTYRIYNSTEKIVIDFIKKYSKKFINGKNLYVTENIISFYEQGSFMVPHIDAPNEVEFVSTVIYLNDDYTGGELSFPEIENGYFYTPEKYELVSFPTAYLHGVNLVKSGKRYIITIGYTNKLKYKNPIY
jgi:Rps23 Pro-64 3,4-dihydroxylase Tpa1-like proline 4-hydroxylase